MIKNILFSFLLSFSVVSYCSAQQQSLDWVNAHAVSIDNNKNYLPALATELKDNTILGMGEPSHGSHEFSIEKGRIIKYLIERGNYKAVGFESAYSVMQRINRYVLLGLGDLKQIMKPLRLFDTKELYDLFQYIKQYNSGQLIKNKVTIFGFDIDYMKADIDSSANTCLDYLAKHPNQYAYTKTMIAILTRITTPEFENLYDMSDDKKLAIADLIKAVRANKQPGDVELEKFKKHLSLLYQGTLVTNPLARDEFMADNIVAAQQKYQCKTIIWSHNVHTAKDTTMAMCKAMGYYLRQLYQKQYYTIGFDTFKGSTNSIVDDNFQANSFEMQPTSLSALFAKAKYPNFFINVNNAEGNPLYNVSANITNIFSNWGRMRTLQIRPGIDFNALIFLRETTASTELK